MNTDQARKPKSRDEGHRVKKCFIGIGHFDTDLTYIILYCLMCCLRFTNIESQTDCNRWAFFCIYDYEQQAYRSFRMQQLSWVWKDIEYFSASFQVHHTADWLSFFGLIPRQSHSQDVHIVLFFALVFQAKDDIATGLEVVESEALGVVHDSTRGSHWKLLFTIRHANLVGNAILQSWNQSSQRQVINCDGFTRQLVLWQGWCLDRQRDRFL